MNILLLCHEYPPLGGGGGVGAKQYAEAWALKGHRVTVLTSRVPGLLRQEKVQNVNIIRIFTIGQNGRATVPFLVLLSYCIFGLFYVLLHLRELRGYDVINSHFSVPTGILGVLVAKLVKLPHVLTIIGGDIYDPTKRSSPHRHALMRVINRFVMHSADSLVAISSDTKRNALRYYDIRRTIHIINYGFDPAELGEPSAVEREPQQRIFQLISVGRLISRKGYEYLIEAMSRLPADVQLVIVGDGPLEAALKQLANERKVAGRITFAGYQTRSKIYWHLQQADCYVLASLHEGLGIVVQEAMYAGLPIVATDNGGQIDLLQEPRNALLVKPQNSDMLVTAIRSFYEDRSLAQSVGRNNREDIERYFMSTNCEEYIHLFHQLIHSRRGVDVIKRRPFTVTERVQ